MRNRQDVAAALHDSSFSYEPFNLLPDGLDDRLEKSEGCSCQGPCRGSDGCACIEEHGCFYDEQGKINLDAVPERHALYECSDACSCSSECGNRSATMGIRLELFVQATIRGLGLFAANHIARGSFVCLYAGEIISQSEAKQRWQTRKHQKLGNYVLVLRETLSDGSALKTIIDPTHRGNLGRFINHACPPLTNCELLPVRPVDHLIPFAAIFASRDVEAGEELSFDYAGGSAADGGQPNDGTRCLCGSSRCRGWLPFDPSL